MKSSCLVSNRKGGSPRTLTSWTSLTWHTDQNGPGMYFSGKASDSTCLGIARPNLSLRAASRRSHRSQIGPVSFGCFVEIEVSEQLKVRLFFASVNSQDRPSRIAELTARGAKQCPVDWKQLPLEKSRCLSCVSAISCLMLRHELLSKFSGFWRGRCRRKRWPF